MIQNKDSARKIADFLLQIKAIKLQPDKPFVWSSGIKSPIYCDNRKTLSYPKIRTYLRQQFTSAIQEEFGKPDVIAGIATGGIAHGALVAQDMGLPFIYIRGEAKSHGTERLIEGEIEAGQSVVLIEDLISTGGSSLRAAEVLKKEKCLVKGIVSIFNYNLKIAEDNFKKAKVNIVSLCDYNTLIQRAVEINYITEKDLTPLEEWVNNPEGWKK
ncbi:MAG TPA: orotate phosphoribosyltransferase [Bacteroidia bacterium]|jgi:orotate phosphoribosyltransferase|nr:orotate phosphoribosyltransferase [Bacteroidia bacterium]